MFYLFISLVVATVTFDSGDVEFSKIDSYDRISMAGCGVTEDMGRPELPEKLFFRVIPQGMEICGVKIRELESISLKGKFAPYPSQPPERFDRERGAFIPLECTDVYPSTIVELKKVDEYFGEKIATIAVHPLQYLPEDSSLSFVQSVDFSLDYKPSNYINPARSIFTTQRIQRFLSKFDRLQYNIKNKLSYSILKPRNETDLPSFTSDRIDLCIITCDSLTGSFAPLLNWKVRKGVRSALRSVEWIDSYYTGCDLAEKIRNFIKDAYEKWGIGYVLIGGNVNIVPARYVYVDAEYPLGELIPTDMYYACLDGDWDANNNGIFGESEDDVDMGYDIFIGRLPVQTNGEVVTTIEKLVSYEKSSAYGYQKKIMLVGSELFSGNGAWGLDGMLHCESIASEIPPDFTVSKMYEFYGHPTSEEFLDSITSGYNIAYAVCHGYIEDIRVMLSSWPPVVRCDWDTMTNPSGFMYITSCWTNAYDADNFCMHYLLSEEGGGIGIIASTRSDFPECSLPINRGFFEAIFEDSLFSPAEADAASKINGGGSIWWVWENYALNFLGDPEMCLWTDLPDTLSVTYVDTVDVGEQFFDVYVDKDGEPVSDAYVCVSNERVYATAFTDDSGMARFGLIPETEGELSIVVSSHNYIPYEGVIYVNPQRPYVMINDFSPESLSSGDSAKISFEFTNSGGSQAENVTIRCTTSDSMVALMDTLFSISDIYPGESDTVTTTIHISKDYRRPLIYVLLDIFYNDSLSSRDSIFLYVYYPEISHYGHSICGIVPDTFSLSVILRNSGFGLAESLTVLLSSDNIVDNIEYIESIPPDTIILLPDAFSFAGDDSVFDLTITDRFGRIWEDIFIVRDIQSPDGLCASPGEASISITWQPVDIAMGYNIYRSQEENFGYTRLNRTLQGENSLYIDDGIPPGTGFYYRVSTVDSFMNESSLSACVYEMTNPGMALGWPKKGPVEKCFWSPFCADIDKSYPGKEVLCACDDGYMYGWHSDGSDILGGSEFKNLGYPVWGRSAVGDVDSDGEEEVVVVTFWASSACSLYVLNGDGQTEEGFPVLLPDAGVGVIGSPALGDIYGDGFLEIIVLTFSGNLYLIDHTGCINLFANVGVNTAFSSPCVADIDSDDTLEIIAGGDSLYVWKPTGEVVDGFPVRLDSDVISSPSIADIEPSSEGLEIITATENKLWILDRFGNSLSGWPQEYQRPSSEEPGIAVGDIDGDGELEVAMVCFEKVCVWDKHAELLPNWPVRLRMRHLDGLPASPPLIADVDGDNGMEVIIGGTDGSIYSIEPDASLTPGFPIQTYCNIKRSPVIEDIDEDGLNEIIASNSQGSYLYVWNVEGDTIQWGSARHDRWNTGLYGFKIPEITGVMQPPQKIVSMVEIFPNPAKIDVIVKYRLSERSLLKIKIYDLCGRVIKTVWEEYTDSGIHSVKWDGRSSGGDRVSCGVYFIKFDAGSESTTTKIIYMR